MHVRRRLCVCLSPKTTFKIVNVFLYTLVRHDATYFLLIGSFSPTQKPAELFLACFPYFEKKIKFGLCDLHAVCVSMNPSY
jgi:hypothetical protein